VAIIDIGEARRKLGTKKISVTADSPTAEHLACVGYRRLEVEKFVYERPKALSESAGPEAVRRIWGSGLSCRLLRRSALSADVRAHSRYSRRFAVGTGEIAPAVPSRQAVISDHQITGGLAAPAGGSDCAYQLLP